MGDNVNSVMLAAVSAAKVIAGGKVSAKDLSEITREAKGIAERQFTSLMFETTSKIAEYCSYANANAVKRKLFRELKKSIESGAQASYVSKDSGFTALHELCSGGCSLNAADTHTDVDVDVIDSASLNLNLNLSAAANSPPNPVRNTIESYLSQLLTGDSEADEVAAAEVEAEVGDGGLERSEVAEEDIFVRSARLLIENGADAAAVDDNGFTPLLLSVAAGR
jgi:ankyrin repeat protein